MRNIKSIMHGKYGRITAILLSMALLLTGLVFPAETADLLGGNEALGASGERIVVITAQDLLAISQRVNGGESFAGKTIAIEAEIQLGELEAWEPIGTAEQSFDGLFDGGELIIHGLPQSTTLFGYTKTAVIQDTTLAVRTQSGLQDVQAYLLETAEETTIQNCHVILEEYSPFTLFGFSSAVPDTSWYVGHESDTGYTISGLEQLLGLAQLVNEGTANFSGKTISLAGDADMSGLLWKPIGTTDRPFMGTFTSTGTYSTLSGLYMDDVTVGSAGLFGHIKNASISKIHMVDASVAAANNVGILVGHMTDSTVSDCYTTGKVSGVTSIGGVIGYATHTLDTINSAYKSYSTADVVGTNMVGGFVGQIDGKAQISTCFATGNVSGVLEVGGFIGKTSTTTSKVSYVASTGNVKGSGKIGGIVGGGVSGTSAMYSYTSSRVEAFSDSGAIMGAVGNTSYTYTSGQIYGPANDGYINAGVGFSGTSSNSLANWDAVGNTIGRTSGISGGPWFINASGVQQTTLGSNFTSGLLEYASGSGVERLPTGGYYPQLNVFNSAGGAFAAFSNVSTDAQLVRMPVSLVNLNGYLAEAGASEALTLPDAGGQIVWRFEDGGTTLLLDDSTVAGGTNSITIESGKLRMEHPAVAQYTIVLMGEVSGLEGLVLKKTIVIKDENIRPILALKPKALNTDTSGTFPDEDRLSNMETSLYIEYSEPLTKGTGTTTVTLTTYSNDWSTAGAVISVSHALISDTILKLEWPADTLGYNQNFKLEILTPANSDPNKLGIKDRNGNPLNGAYYLISSPNMVAKLSFSAYVSNQISLNNDADGQVIRMLQNDANYHPSDYLAGILSENETTVVVTDADISFQTVNSMFGSAAYPAQPGDTSLTAANFYKYPGTYTLTYQVPDPEEPHRLSNEIVRTYHVTAEIKDWFFADGVFGETYLDAHQPSISMDAATIVAILLDSTPQTAHSNIIAALQEQLTLRHKATAGGTGGQEEGLEITYDFSRIGAAAYKDGFNGVVLYGIDGATPSEPLYVQIESVLNPLMIATVYERFQIAPESFEQEKILSYFQPTLQHTTNRSADILADWTVEGSVALAEQYTNQMVTVRADNIYGMPDLRLTKDVFVSLVPGTLVQEVFPDPSAPRVDADFWQRIEVHLRRSEPGAVVDANLKYEYAYAPRSVFHALDLEGHSDVTLAMHMANGISLLMNSDSFDFADLESPAELFNVYIEEIENLDVNRDARGEAVQQFYVRGLYDNPSSYSIQIPLDDALSAKEELNLYTYDSQARTYALVSSFVQEDYKNGKLVTEMGIIDGEYVIAERMPSGIEEPVADNENFNPGTGK